MSDAASTRGSKADAQRNPAAAAQLAAGVAAAWARVQEPGSRRRMDVGGSADARYGAPRAMAGTPAGAVPAGPDPRDPAQGALLAMPAYGALTAEPMDWAAPARRSRLARAAASVALTVVASGALGWGLAQLTAAPAPADPRAGLDTTPGQAVPPPVRTPFLARYPFGGAPR